MLKRIVLMTANVQGGIIQFTFQLYHILKELGYSVKVCMPYELHDSNIDEVAEPDRILYHKAKKVIDKRPFKELAHRIEALQPNYVWYCDDSVICSEVGLALKDFEMKQLLTVHDAGGYHPTHHESLRSKILHQYVRLVNCFYYRRVYRFILLSSESGRTFKQRWPQYATSVSMMNLGAHIPQAYEEQPQEVAEGAQYLLFFGRIDKYKGIGGLLDAYRQAKGQVLPLVIAGSGALSDEEKAILNKVSNVTLINRYIGDGEMKWLFSHSVAVVLPYIEATQSGIIPIAYAYSKPVLVSDIPGLTQFVIDGETGWVCKTREQWVENLRGMNVNVADEMTASVSKYFADHLDWKRNVERMLSRI